MKLNYTHKKMSRLPNQVEVNNGTLVSSASFSVTDLPQAAANSGGSFFLSNYSRGNYPWLNTLTLWEHMFLSPLSSFAYCGKAHSCCCNAFALALKGVVSSECPLQCLSQ